MKIAEIEKQWLAIRRFDQHRMLCCVQTKAKRLLADFPEFWVAWVSYGVSLYAMARYSEALAALRKAMKLCPPTGLHLIQKHFGHLYERRGNFHRAAAWFRRAIASRPSDSGAYIYLGALLALEGRLPEAEAIHRQATLCDHGCIDEAYFNLGLVLRAQEKYAEARSCFQRALKIAPKDRDVRRALADVNRVIELTRHA